VTEPEPIFSTCFASPFLVLPPERYADMLIERVNRHHAEVWMLNTGWVGGPYGVGQRMSIAHTRAIVREAIDRLPDSYRAVLLLRDIEELSTEETAQSLGVTANAVKIRLHRARQALRGLLEPHFRGAVS